MQTYTVDDTEQPNVLVIAILGNGVTFDSGIAQWSSSPAFCSDYAICVPTTENEQAVYTNV